MRGSFAYMKLVVGLVLTQSRIVSPPLAGDRAEAAAFISYGQTSMSLLTAAADR
ncbi:hypothetical protein ABK730_22505 [Klebsiella indica]|uniref:hypothetical protein n=1 Tax=Klebsiella TaxID=570 RepID=UPI001485F43A|nr:MULTISPECIES: hypothetical protein [Klebsiella]